MIVRQTLAMFHDAYRELNARKLFWVVLLLSGMFVLVYASLNFDETGMSLFFGLWHVDHDLLRAGSPMASLLYRGIFATFVVPIWLAWIATILALVSTASVFPDFVAGGSIDLVLCRPISRLRLFLTKYIASLLFVVLQVTVFCVGIFICMGWRLGDWEWKVFAAIPLVTLMFSYLFSVCVLLGVWTRSALAALLLTLLMWFSLFSISGAEGILLQIKTSMDVEIEELKSLETTGKRLPGSRHSGPWSMRDATIPELQSTLEPIERWLRRVQLLKLPLPKTSETIGLLDRMLSREGDVNILDLMQGRVMLGVDGKPMRQVRRAEDRVEQRLIQYGESQSLWMIIGTSLLFEAVVLGIAAWLFCRRDF